VNVSYIGNKKQRIASFGSHLRALREAKAQTDPAFSLRQLALRCGVTPPYLSRLERDEVAPPSEEVLRLLAAELGEDTDVMLALGGKISTDLRAAILARPKLFAELIRSLKDMPDHAVLSLVREVQDGDW
jgi:transcriptional regulator with XRE-family HTH domain